MVIFGTRFLHLEANSAIFGRDNNTKLRIQNTPLAEKLHRPRAYGPQAEIVCTVESGLVQPWLPDRGHLPNTLLHLEPQI